MGFVRFLGCRCLGTLRRVALGSPLLGVVSFFVKKGAALCGKTGLPDFGKALAADFSFVRATGRLAALLTGELHEIKWLLLGAAHFSRIDVAA